LQRAKGKKKARGKAGQNELEGTMDKIFITRPGLNRNGYYYAGALEDRDCDLAAFTQRAIVRCGARFVILKAGVPE
jgi:hypothetical protein